LVGGIGCRDGEAEHLPIQPGPILGVALWRVARARVAGPAPVARAQVQVAIRPEAQRPAAVVGLRLLEPEDVALGAWVGPVAVVGWHMEFAERVGVVLARGCSLP